MYAHTELNAGIIAAKKQRVQHVCVCVRDSVRVSVSVCVLLLSLYFRYTNTAYQLSQKRARSKLRYTQTHTHIRNAHLPPTLPFSNERKKVHAHPFRALKFKKRKSKQMAKLAHKQTRPPACV